MKKIIAAIALSAVAFVVLAAAIGMPAQIAQHSRTQEAEQMVSRLTIKLTLATNGCSEVEPIAMQRACKQTVAEFYPALTHIRNAAAANSEAVELLWPIIVSTARNLETSIDGMLKALETSPYKKSPASLRG